MIYHYQTEFLGALQNPALYDHPTFGFELIETHISWILLTGPFAYKIKKPVNLGFVDFSTLEKRRYYCREELRLNRRLAPMLYLDVVGFGGTPQQPLINGPIPFEYAVKMEQFPANARLDHVLQQQQLHPSHIDQLARDIARFHASIATAGGNAPWGEPEGIHEISMDNFTILLQLTVDNKKTDAIKHIRQWSNNAFHRLMETMHKRKRNGCIRECHGDMHLGNMVLLNNRVIVFDCIEFNPSLYWIDVMSELAFLVMDLEQRGKPGLAFRFLNKQLEYSGDYSGLVLLNYYRVYRAMVRAKVAGIRLSQTDADSKLRISIQSGLQSYLSLAERYTKAGKPRLFITHGFSGSGKTHLTHSLLEQLGAIRIRSDIERKRLFGLPPNARTDSATDAGIYSRQTSHRVYQQLLMLAESLLQSGYPVIVDATFLRKADRVRFRQLGDRLRVPVTILDFQAEIPMLRARIQQRSQHGKDASEATLAVLEQQLVSAEPLTNDEQPQAVTIDTATETTLYDRFR